MSWMRTTRSASGAHSRALQPSCSWRCSRLRAPGSRAPRCTAVCVGVRLCAVGRGLRCVRCACARMRGAFPFARAFPAPRKGIHVLQGRAFCCDRVGHCHAPPRRPGPFHFLDPLAWQRARACGVQRRRSASLAPPPPLEQIHDGSHGPIPSLAMLLEQTHREQTT
jgi:hypothetical protein